jgi:hypothetical protein
VPFFLSFLSCVVIIQIILMREGSKVFHQLRLFALLAAKVVNTKPQRPEMAFTKSNQSGGYERIS